MHQFHQRADHTFHHTANLWSPKRSSVDHDIMLGAAALRRFRMALGRIVYTNAEWPPSMTGQSASTSIVASQACLSVAVCARRRPTLVEDLKIKGCGLIVLSMSGVTLDTTNPTSKLMLTMLAAVAEFERDLMKERQAEGIAKAQGDGKYKGRKPSARSQAEEVKSLASQGVSAAEIARRLKIGRTSAYRCLGRVA